MHVSVVEVRSLQCRCVDSSSRSTTSSLGAPGNFAKLHLYFRAMRERYRSRNCARSFRENREAVPALLPLALPGCRGILISGQACLPVADRDFSEKHEARLRLFGSLCGEARHQSFSEFHACILSTADFFMLVRVVDFRARFGISCMYY